MSSTEYTGVFDLPASGGGLNESERLLARLCRKSFLSLWAFPNLHTDEGFQAGVGSAKEFTDVLLVFGDDVVLFSDKHVAFNEDKTVEVAWVRWYRRAIQQSAKQLYGALRWLQRYPTRIFLDAKCNRPLPVNLPDPSCARYHLVAVTRGSYEACAKWFPGSLGTLQIRSDIGADPDPKRPFAVGRCDPSKPFIHVFDEFSLEVVLGEFDTAVDFITYLRAREAFLANPSHLISAAGEEQLVASYLLNMKGDEHWFTPAFEDGKEPNLLSFGESLYPGLRDRPEYKAKKAADEPSYYWDAMIEQFIRLGDPEILDPPIAQDKVLTEEGLRIIASESRFRRRLLTETLRETILKAKAKPTLKWFARTVAAPEMSNRVYIFLVIPKSSDESYKEYRKHRVSVLHAYCRCAKLRIPGANTFVGMAFDHPVRDYAGSSEDLFIYKCDELTDEQRAETERYRQELGILPDNLEPQDRHAEEFPSVAQHEQHASLAEAARGDMEFERTRRRKHKREMAKDSRRRNRRKK